MIRISNKIKTLLAMLSFVQVTSGCDATVQDIIIDTDPGVEIGIMIIIHGVKRHYLSLIKI